MLHIHVSIGVSKASLLTHQWSLYIYSLYSAFERHHCLPYVHLQKLVWLVLPFAGHRLRFLADKFALVTAEIAASPVNNAVDPRPTTASSTTTMSTASRVRTVLTEYQLRVLRTCYAVSPRPDAATRDQLMEMTGLSARVIRVWFQNKRCKDKKRAVVRRVSSSRQIRLCTTPALDWQTNLPAWSYTCTVLFTLSVSLKPRWCCEHGWTVSKELEGQPQTTVM